MKWPTVRWPDETKLTGWMLTASQLGALAASFLHLANVIMLQETGGKLLLPYASRPEVIAVLGAVAVDVGVLGLSRASAQNRRHGGSEEDGHWLLGGVVLFAVVSCFANAVAAAHAYDATEGALQWLVSDPYAVLLRVFVLAALLPVLVVYVAKAKEIVAHMGPRLQAIPLESMRSENARFEWMGWKDPDHPERRPGDGWVRHEIKHPLRSREVAPVPVREVMSPDLSRVIPEVHVIPYERDGNMRVVLEGDDGPFVVGHKGPRLEQRAEILRALVTSNPAASLEDVRVAIGATDKHAARRALRAAGIERGADRLLRVAGEIAT